MAATSDELTDAVLQSVQHGAYPDSESIVSAELSADKLPSLLQALDSARDEVKSDIRNLSRQAAPDIDGWIAQAKQLQADIERSKATAREIVEQAEAGRTLHSKIEDASNQVALLEKELAFNGTLSNTLADIKTASDIVDSAKDASIAQEILVALDGLEEVDKILASNRARSNTKVHGLLQSRIKSVRDDLIEETMSRWHALVRFNDNHSRITIQSTIKRDSHPASMNDVATALIRLDLLDSVLGGFCKDFVKFVRSCFALGKNKTFGLLRFNVTEDEGTLEKEFVPKKPPIESALENFEKIIQWLDKFLPPQMTTTLSSDLLPSLISQFIKDWLEPGIPSSLKGMQDFEAILEKISDTAESIGKFGWAGREDLVDWVDTAPRTWLTKRRERALDAARQTMLKNLSETRVVERVETEIVSKDDVIEGEPEKANDEWDSAWDDADGKILRPTQPAETKDEEDEDTSAWDEDDSTIPHPTKSPEPKNEEDEDTSAWDTEDGLENHNAQDPLQSADREVNGNEEEAWGWGDDNQESPKVSKTPTRSKKQHPKMDGSDAGAHASAEREITLRETLTVTLVPDGILEIVLQVVADAENLAKPEFSSSTIAPAAAGLYALPTLVFAMYRATASTYYSTLQASNMFIYNDSARLSDQLRSFLREQTQKDELSNLRPNAKSSAKLKLEADIKALDSFGRRAYGQEMESQRTILRDLLDGAQGFANCTRPPFAAECDNAVSMTIDRVREVHNQWQDILSRSALLQSIGSLVFTVISKVIADIKDMSDISEAESQRLRHFCDEISTLNDLFVQTHPDGSVASDMTLYVVPNWFKFQFLGQIMESSLADIVYMWKESELKLEYDAMEIIDLIEALFAESEHRRKAIGEIKKSVSGGGL